MSTGSLHAFRIELQMDLHHASEPTRRFLVVIADSGRGWAMAW